VPARPRGWRGAGAAAQGLQGAQRTSQVERSAASSSPSTRRWPLQPGDLCLILIDQVEEALDHIAKRVAGN
jgi:cyanophycin synthetase